MSTSSRRGRFWSAYVGGGLTVLAAGLLWQSLADPPRAYGQVPDSGQQRIEMISELKASNQKLAEVVTLLREIRDLQAGARKDPAVKPASLKP